MTDRVEKALATINNVKAIRSSSSEDSSRVTLDFNWRTNLYYMQTDDFGATWKTVEGTVLQTPLVMKPTLHWWRNSGPRIATSI